MAHSRNLSRHPLLALLGLALTARAAIAQEPAARVGAPAFGRWEEQVLEQVVAEEYRFSNPRPDLFTAPNRAHGLRTRISPSGIEVRAREAVIDSAASWTLGLSTAGLGRAGGRDELFCGAITADGPRVALDHGPVTEWFENTPRGVEQGWTVWRRPGGQDALEIAIAVSGDLSLRIDDGRRSGVFVDASGVARVRYTGLRAEDAAGRELDARLVPTPEGVAIQVEDDGALYPLTVDPLLESPTWSITGDQVGENLGIALATAGDVNGDGYSDCIVAAWGYDGGQVDEGRVFVYHGSASGLAASAEWSFESDQDGAFLGSSVGCAGDVNGDGYSDVIVGAESFANGEDDEGRALVFHGSASGLSTTPDWTVESNQVIGFLGHAVACAGDVNGDGFSDVIVGVPGHEATMFGVQQGGAQVYLGSSGGLALEPAWSIETEQNSALLGVSVACAGDVNGDGYDDVIVGAQGYDNGEFDEGGAFLFLGSTSGLAETPAWSTESDQASANLGHSVATAGDVNGDGYSDVIVGAPRYDNGVVDEGRAYMFLGSAAGLSATADWVITSDNLTAHFGTSVACAGDVNGDGHSDVIVGAEFDGLPVSARGRAYVYLGASFGLWETPAWSTDSGQDNATFGSSVAGAGDVNGDGYSDVIVGAPAFDVGGDSEGAAFLYLGSAAGLADIPSVAVESNQVGAALGVSVAMAGDVDGDGYTDVLVGADGFDGGQVDEGRAFLYLGSPEGMETTAAWTAESDQAGASFGQSVAAAGDVNGDGFADVVVGAPGFDGGELDEGRAFVYLGSALGLASSAAWTAEANQAGAAFGNSVAGAGDVNGDGFSDVLIGAPLFDGGQPGEGRASVYLGSAAGLSTAPAWTAEPDRNDSGFGWSVATAGDVNADGYSDVVIGAERFSNGQGLEGAVFVYHGSAGGPGSSAAWAKESDLAGSRFGWAVSTAGDVNGDGYSDVLVGSIAYSGGEPEEGRAQVYHGSADGLLLVASWSVESDQADGALGSSVSSAGDVNGDGYSDVVIGASRFETGAGEGGRAFVYHGSATGLATSPAWTASSGQSGAFFGRSVAGGGDVNGDGFSDVLVGAHRYSGGQNGEGRFYLAFGNNADGGIVHALRQRNRGDTRPLSVLGRTGPSGFFRVHAELEHSLAGFAWASPATPSAWLEWEVKPLSVLFDGSGIEAGVPQSLDLPAGAWAFDETLASSEPSAHLGYTDSRLFHWRARIATSHPLFPHTAWFSVPANSITEAKVRRPPVAIR